MSRRKQAEQKKQYAVMIRGEQIVATGVDYSWKFSEIAAEYAAMYECDISSVAVDGGWTLEELKAWAKADVAPSYILEDDFVWN